MLNLHNYGSSQPFNWSHNSLMDLLTKGKRPFLQTPELINSFKQIDRGNYVPDDMRELAYHDRLIKIGYGQKGVPPSIVAQKLELLKPKYGGKYLHLGTGTGYLASILAHVAGDLGKVYSLERIQLMWHQAREIASNYLPSEINLEILYRDGKDGLPQQAPYDGILLSYVPSDYPSSLLSQLGVGGKLIFPNPNHQLHIIERLDNDDYVEETFPGFNSYAFGNYKAGTA